MTCQTERKDTKTQDMETSRPRQLFLFRLIVPRKALVPVEHCELLEVGN